MGSDKGMKHTYTHTHMLLPVLKHIPACSATLFLMVHEQRITNIELYSSKKISLVIRSHPFVGIYIVNNGTNITGFEVLRAK